MQCIFFYSLHRNIFFLSIQSIFFSSFIYPYSPTKASGGMFSNVTGKVSGWLPSSLPSVSMPTVSMPTMPNVSMPAMPSIPGLRKAQTTEEGVAADVPEQAVEAQPLQSANEKDEDDRSR